MRKLQTLTFAAMIALSLLASTTDAFAKDAKHGRETAWTNLGDGPALDAGEFRTDGVTWE